MIQGENIILRALEPSDVDKLYDWENDTSIWRLSHTTTPFSRHNMEQYVLSVHDIHSDRQLRLMICEKNTGNAVGCIDLFDFDPVNGRAGVGVLVDNQERGKGHASEAVELLKGYAFDVLKLHQLYASIPVDNAPSLKLFEGAGFEHTATQKDWLKTGQGWQDEYLLQLINDKG